MILRARLTSSIGVSLLLAVLAPRLARACGAIEPALPSSTPASGGELPANAAIRFDGPSHFASPAVTVTVSRGRRRR